MATPALECIVDASKVRSVVDLLRGIDMSQIDRRLIGRLGDNNYVNGLREEAIRFLGIAAGGEGSFAPSKTVDEYWHEMVMNTPFYAAVCARIGTFIHHRPSERAEIEAYARTLEAYRAIFGEPDSRYWKVKDAADCDSFCSSGACEADCRY